MRIRVTVRCYAELNDFLPASRRQQAFQVESAERRSVKDLLESLGVPHTEVDLLLLNGESVAFDALLSDGDRVAAYPVFEAFDVARASRVRVQPLRTVRFVLDVHLGRLAGFLRLAGFDTLYDHRTGDEELARLSNDEHRILLTRDLALLKRGVVTHGSYVRATDPAQQFAEVARRFHLSGAARPFTRCMRCNGLLAPVAKDEVAASVPPRSRAGYERFLRCAGCGRVYWEGSHHRRLREILEAALQTTE